MAKKKKKKSAGKKMPSLLSGGQIPRDIMGANFDPSLDCIETLERRIAEGVNKDKDDIRVMFVSESSYLHTGFATYAQQILKRLSKIDNLSVAELGSYGHGADKDPRAEGMEWKYYSNMPANPQEEQEYQAGYQKNQFGLFKFDQAMNDFQPDVLLLHRDWWMDEFVVNHILSKRCHVIWMACVDSYPQKWEWMKDFQKVDTLMSYSHFGKKVLEDQSRTELAKRHGIEPMDCSMVAQAGVNPGEFRPLDKSAVKQKFGINPDVKIVGTVMRNQPRKLFTRIIDSFADLLEHHPETGARCALLLHTGIPDVGFDIPESVFRNGVEGRVLFSHICHNCGDYGVSTWGFTNKPCKVCGHSESVKTPNTNKGLTTEQFNEIYNLMDLYVQGSIAGADEMPATEAKACGVPVTCTDYAAMYEKNRNGGAIPIKVECMYTEAETMQNRAMFCRKSLTDNMKKVLSSDFTQSRLASEGRKTAVESYDWDLAGLKWLAAIMEADLKDRVCWENQTLAAVVNTEGGTPEELAVTMKSLEGKVDSIVMDGDSHDKLWTLNLNAGEELAGEDINFLRKECNQNSHVEDCVLELICLKEVPYGLDIGNNDGVVQPRLRKVSATAKPSGHTSLSENENRSIVSSSQRNATTYFKCSGRMSMDNLDEEQRELKKIQWCHVSAAIDEDTNVVPYIIRRRA